MKLRSFLVIALAALLPAIAAAQQARTLNAVALRAGPDREYPFVASYGPGTPIEVLGCIQGYGWCDVIGPNGYRGWVYAGDIAYLYQRREVPVISYGPAIGIPIVTFALGSYWADHYHHRSWYRDRDRWERYRPVYREPPRQGRPVHRDGRDYDRRDYDRRDYDRRDSDRPNQKPLPRGGVVHYDDKGRPTTIITPPTRDPNAPAPARGQQ